jgi:hypothetical protein
MIILILILLGVVFGNIALVFARHERDVEIKQPKTWKDYKFQFKIEDIACSACLAVVFALSYIFWPFAITGGLDIAVFLTFLTLLLGLTILFVCDLKWKRLPKKVLTYCVLCAVIFIALRLCGAFSFDTLLELIGALAVLPGVYFVLYKASKSKLAGSMDWLLAIPLALVSGNFWVAFFVLFIANLLGSLIMLPVFFLRKKKKQELRVCIGLFLIAGFLTAFLAQNWLISLLGF